MLRIRLRRVGKKGKPSYRIVVAESSSPRDGAYLEWIGNYDPMKDPPAVLLKEDRAVHWLSQGAQPSDAVERILDKNGISRRTPAKEPSAGADEDSAA
jgi:small subunit ribosomal protein S16